MDPAPPAFDANRRALLAGGAMMGLASAGPAMSAPTPDGRSDTEPRTYQGQPMPEPPPERGAGPVRPGAGSQLTGKVAVVTGAARGIGRAIAVAFAANGADVVALDLCREVSPVNDAKPATAADLAETVRQIRGWGRRGEGVQLDIRDIAALRAAADRIEVDYGRIDIVVANAAIQHWKPLLEQSDAEWRDVIENNVNGTANTVRAFAPKMVARRRGRLILVSSMQGKHGTKNAASYSASKHAIIGLAKSAALELGEHNITVNILIPGLVDTALTRYEKRFKNSMAETGQTPPEHPTARQAWDSRAPTVPMKVGWLQPDDIAPAAVFLASDAAALVTGAEYEVTAGDSAKST